MTHTKFAIVALYATTADVNTGPKWWQAAKALTSIAAALYIAWYVWCGPEPLERPRVRRQRKADR